MNIFSFLYADDIIVLAESNQEMQLALSAKASYCKKNKLKVNHTKSEIVIFSRGKVRTYPIFDFDGVSLKYSCEYNYLGMFKYNNKFGSALTLSTVSATHVDSPLTIACHICHGGPSIS